jgi:hypothetical protein
MATHYATTVIPSHKREKCTIKAADREAGLTRVYHPDRDKAVSNHDKAKVAASAAAKEISNAIMSSSAMPPNPPMQYQWSYPWMAPPFQGAVNPWQYPQTGQDQAVINAARIEHERKTQTAPTTASANATMANPCPYPTCHAVLPNQYATQEHMRMFHGQSPTLAAGPGVNP